MAQRTVIQLSDDLDGGQATDTVRFGLDGSSYEIDLNEAHAEDLREVLAPFVFAARRLGGGGTRRPRAAAPKQRASSAKQPAGEVSGEVEPKAVRAWAQAHGIEVNARGRLKADVIEQYKAANN